MVHEQLDCGRKRFYLDHLYKQYQMFHQVLPHLDLPEVRVARQIEREKQRETVEVCRVQDGQLIVREIELLHSDSAREL